MLFFNSSTTYLMPTTQVSKANEIIFEAETKSVNGLLYDYDSTNNILLVYTQNNGDVNTVFSDITLTFNDLFFKWKQETLFTSSTKIFDDINYQKIVALGKDILPTLIDKLDGTSTFLFFALYKITGKNPVLPEHYGNIVLMTGDWKNWWKENKEQYA